MTTAIGSIPKPARRGPKPRARLKRSPLPRRGAPLKRGKRPNARKVGATAEMRREATDLCRAIVRKMAGPRCQYRAAWRGRCNQEGTDAAHVLNKKAHPSVRYALGNLLWLCRPHHEIIGDAPVIGPSPMRDIYEQIHSPESFGFLCELARKPGPYLLDIVADLRLTASALGIVLPPSPAASTARKGKPVAHDRKAPTTKRPKSHQVVKESQAVAPGSVETARRLSGSEER
jgi:hypothetical protein